MFLIKVIQFVPYYIIRMRMENMFYLNNRTMFPLHEELRKKMVEFLPVPTFYI
jgi:hypothetical protein